MHIRQAIAADADILAELNRDVQQLHADAAPHLFKQPDDLSPVAADFLTRVLTDPDGFTFIAEDESGPVGYIYARLVQRPENAYNHAYRLLHIDQISVKPASRGRGYGRALMEAAYGVAREAGIQLVTLDTWAFNADALAFYAHLGFKPMVYRLQLTEAGG
ncbi:MAG: ribosomal-protein-alanine acetyltransferase [Chloroflexota bacterium]|jgi:GNAT superfamily N-acetyltransferase|nr:MAG: ribosomal-protein-alanine acetyltransferase [Chloroflexota bacterium]